MKEVSSNTALDHGAALEGLDPLFVAGAALLNIDFLFHALVNLGFAERRGRAVVNFEDFDDGVASRVLEWANDLSDLAFVEEGIAEGPVEVDAIGVAPESAIIGKGSVRVFLGEFSEVGSAFEFIDEFFGFGELAFGVDVGVEGVLGFEENFLEVDLVFGGVAQFTFALLVLSLDFGFGGRGDFFKLLGAVGLNENLFALGFSEGVAGLPVFFEEFAEFVLIAFVVVVAEAVSMIDVVEASS